MARSAALLALVLAPGTLSCRGGCGRAPAPLRSPGWLTLSALPTETRFLLSMDLARVRASPVWARLSALAAEDPRDRARLRELQARTGLDPVRDLQRVVAAFPGNAQQTGQFAVMVDGEHLDEHRLVGYVRAEVATRGVKLASRPHGTRTLWSSGASTGTAAFFVGSTRLVLGGGGWAETLAEVSGGQGPNATEQRELVDLVSRIEAGRALWFAALVPPDLRESLRNDPRWKDTASVTRLAGSLELNPGLTAELVVDLSTAAEARVLAETMSTTLRESKRDARILMMGLGPYLDSLSVTTDGPRLRATLVLNPDQVKDLLDRVAGLLRLARGGKRP